MSVIKPSILDRVKAKLQAVFARHQPADVPARSETSTTNTAAPETGAAQGRETPAGAKDVGSDLSLPWLTDTQCEILRQMERRTTTERRLIDRARILSNVETFRSKKGVARTLGIDIKTVRTWHARWDEVRGVLSPLETGSVPRQAYRLIVEEALKDAPAQWHADDVYGRAGRPHRGHGV